MPRIFLRGWKRWLFLLPAMLPWLLWQPSGADAASGGQWPAVTESSGCGQLRTFPPLATRMGRLPRTEIVGGPYGALFGRTIGEVEDSQVWWTVPMSGGKQIRVHARSLPAFQQVTANLAAAAAQGKWYSISVARGQSSRTVAGKLSMSYHAFGAAVDINPPANPYRSDNVLITDMPAWFVQAWKDAGFCWGGDWLDLKDTMHFSWKGPLPTPGYGTIPVPVLSRSRPASFAVTQPMAAPPFGQLDGARRYLIGDATGHGAPDVVQLTQHDLGIVINVAKAHLDYAGCDVDRAFAWDARLADRTLLLGDFDATARSDLWEIDASGPVVVAIIHTSASEFNQSKTYPTGIVPQTGDAYMLGDVDGDGWDDLFVLRRTDVTRLEVWTSASGFLARAVDVEILAADTRAWRFAIGDRNVDGRPDLYAVEPAATGAVVHVLAHADGYARVSETLTTAAFLGVNDVLAMADYDGDGRDDLLVLAVDGSLRSFLGNFSGAADPAGWFRDRNWECDEESEPYWFAGKFRDDDGSIFEEDINWLAAAGLTTGCNWPYGDGYCPDRPVTRAEMATFLTRALGLETVPGDQFLDVDNPTHEPNINAIAAAGLTVGCTPDGSRYCPDRPVTRAEMATLLARGMRLEPVPGDQFLDVDNPTHEPNINAIAAAGLTVGCTPDGSRYCPTELVSRGQMAALLHRALAHISF